jgi:uncharacterized damage-inducible protein DinB
VGVPVTSRVRDQPNKHRRRPGIIGRTLVIGTLTNLSPMTNRDTDRQPRSTDWAGARTEREVLETFLDSYREIVKRKVSGLREDEIRQRRVGSLTTLAGVLKHLAVAERSWFQRTLAQLSDEQIGALSHGRDERSWLVSDEETVDGLIAEYDEACARSREVAARFELSHTVPHHRIGTVSLRWIYVHMIEETARHAGHADILREQTDGAIGFGD